MPDGNARAPAKKSSTTPLANAIREELRSLLEVDLIDLEVLKSVVGVSEHGRDLLSVRDPVSRFDGRQRLGSATDYGVQITPSPRVGSLLAMGGSWEHGPANQRAKDLLRQGHQALLSKSPLVAALRVEFSELLDQEPFAATHLNQVQQLAEASIRVLSSALGVSPPAQPSPRMACGSSLGPWAPSSSAETFGAAMGRELLTPTSPSKDSAPSISDLTSSLIAAREGGATDVAQGIEEKLRDLGVMPKSKED